ncbi:putative uncharacterized protein DDB_G0280555 [Nylanderia fulva]|uniref:putative uncharacterized protein DDB_G0280555 n=1 Tax=Nylanderia fulva TaxID=613905 RepID=UPI0010FAEB85|nr:putative uncharacterized protein DDB_G0280555 [Nylanderia fulva]XP_029156068.1 putative uncharacterized protein DDB_G0280555 [Nylanderia fulva]XP_029156073.1 putative uncharacterized protein DDB_G0280555 [Nylanderia fulva]XP_029156080.1 putative uncharacterized protein DDB_G0280555 [Nylanderia fulva]
MSLTLRTNRWASRIIIILHLIIWNAVGIVLLQKGVSTLQRRMLEKTNHIKTNSSIGLSIESTTFSIKRTGNEYSDLAIISAQQPLTDHRNGKIIIQIDPESSLNNNDRKYPKLNVISQALRNELEIVSDEKDKNLRSVENNLTEVNRHPESKNAPNRISRIVRDREHIFSNRIWKNLYEDEKNATSLESSSESKEEKNLNSVNEDASTKLFTRENNDRVSNNNNNNNNNNNIPRRGSSRKFSHNGGAVTAVAMVSIGAIMLLVGPIVIILRILDEKRQARKLHALSAAVREDLPPSYEQAVFSSEAPRYSTLALNDDDSSPPPSPTLVSPIFSNSAIKST